MQLWSNVADAPTIPHGTKLQTKEELQVMNARRREEEKKEASKRRKETEICCKTLSAHSARQLLPLRRCCGCALAKKRNFYRGEGRGVATRKHERRRKKGSEPSCRRFNETKCVHGRLVGDFLKKFDEKERMRTNDVQEEGDENILGFPLVN